MGEQKTSKLPELKYAVQFNAALCRRLDNHFRGVIDAEGQGRRALVVGLFGEWGTGKTLHLQHIHNYFNQKLESLTAPSGKKEPQEKKWSVLPFFKKKQGEKTRTQQSDLITITVPIFFNAWRYEAEEHLIIPLLKTTQHQLNAWHKKCMAGNTVAEASSFDWIMERAEAAADSAIALAYGFKGELEVPFFGKMKFDPKAIIEEDKKRQQQRNKQTSSYIDELSSRYYDFESQIRKLTDVDVKNNTQLNLLFLIDDLDRCLPEKTVQMLESIKLFLDVEGCAFVMALDDEVVERGIAYRYRDYGADKAQRGMESIAYSLRPERYREFCNENNPQVLNPITGHEYLEKIIQLQVRIPPPTRNQVSEYLSQHFPEIFGESDGQ